MEVSNREEPGGTELLEQVVSLTGLPAPEIGAELSQIIEQAGHSSGTLTLEQLRESMLAYLESMQANFPEESSDAVSGQEPVSGGLKEKLTLVSE